MTDKFKGPHKFTSPEVYQNNVKCIYNRQNKSENGIAKNFD